MRKEVGAEFGVVGAAGGRSIGVTRQRSRRFWPGQLLSVLSIFGRLESLQQSRRQ
jgi:hypothetical protein